MKEDVLIYLRVGGTREGLRRVLEQSVRAAGAGHRIPSMLEEVTLEMVTVEEYQLARYEQELRRERVG